MSTNDPEITTVTSKGQITIPSALRDRFGYEQGTKLIAVPTEHGIVLQKLDLPSIEDFQERVSARSENVTLSMDDINELVHDARDTEQ